MIIRLPLELQTTLTICIYVILGVIVFLWGSAVKSNSITEDYIKKEINEEILKLRKENKELKEANKKLKSKLEFYVNMLSGVRHLLRKKDES